MSRQIEAGAHAGQALAARRRSFLAQVHAPVGHVRAIADETSDGDAMHERVAVYRVEGVLCMSDGKMLRGTMLRTFLNA